MKVGIVGGGQLARMSILAGRSLGLDFLVLDPAVDACGGQVAEHLVGAYDAAGHLDELARRCDVVTFDFENVPAAAARRLAARCPVYPPPAALETAQDRLAEKTLFEQLGIPLAPYAAVDDPKDLRLAARRVGLPAVLKTRRFGYDGKGQRVLRSEADLAPAWDVLGPAPLILEGFVDFECEVSVLAARGRGGETAFYPLTENVHEAGILRLSRAPRGDAGLEAQAREYAARLLEHLEFVGVLAIELFVSEGGLLANEMAPRVHNSGHWSLDGAVTSQFENHLRAVVGWPLGETRPLGAAAMVNLIGDLPAAERVLAVPDAHLHVYGKAPRPGRKVGHVNVCRDRPEEVEASVASLLALLAED